jgi:hypothetical protein
MIIGEVVLSAYLHMSFLTRDHKCIINYRVETNCMALPRVKFLLAQSF